MYVICLYIYNEVIYSIFRSVSYEIVNQEPFIVPYLSPVVLRKELESLLTQGRSFILSSENFTSEKPILYWNLVWYFTRLRLPTYLPLLLLRKIGKDHPHLKKVNTTVTTQLDHKLVYIQCYSRRFFLGLFHYFPGFFPGFFIIFQFMHYIYIHVHTYMYIYQCIAIVRVCFIAAWDSYAGGNVLGQKFLRSQ